MINFNDLYPTLESKKCFLKLLLLEHGLAYQRILQGEEYAEVAKWIYDAVPKLQDECYNTATRINWILTDRTDFPRCRKCGKPFGIGYNIKAKDGYGKFCSRTCSSTSEETKANIDATYYKHYGTRRIYSEKTECAENQKKKTKTFEINEETISEEAQSFFEAAFKPAAFPIPSATQQEIELEIQKLTSSKQHSDKLYSPIIRRYCPSIWKCESHDTMSPYAYWDYLKTDFAAFQKLYENRMKYKGKVTLDILRDGMNIAKFAGKVTYLKPQLAKRLIKTYLSDATEIFNPFNGFSGIMLGSVLGNGKKYIGQDLNQTFVDEANQIISDLHLQNASVIQKDVFEDSGEYDCLFCCPPYEDFEKWNFDENGRCVDKNLTCDEWINIVLERYKCRKYLFVVDNSIVKHRDHIVEILGNESHVNRNTELVLSF